MRITDFKLFNKPFGLWLISIILLALSFEGILSFPSIVQTSQTIARFIVCLSHALYVIAGVIIIIGLWFSLRITLTFVIFLGIASLGAALGGPLVFSSIQAKFLLTSIIMTMVIIIITVGLFLYSRAIIKK